MKITECKINHLTNPMGFELSSLRASWNVEGAKGKKQKEARILVSLSDQLTDPVLDTGFKDLDPLGTPLDLQLQPKTRYYWTVAVRTDAGEEAASEVQFFETGKLNEAWQGKWITCKEELKTAPVFSKEIHIKKAVQSARLYICGLGLYEVYFRGERIGDEYLAPYCNAYDQWLQYQTYDMTRLLSKDEVNETNGAKETNGTNGTLQVMLGNGWYKGRFGYDSKPGDKGRYGTHYLLIAELQIVYEDGTKEVIGTDTDWMVGESNILSDSIYDGEAVDGRRQWIGMGAGEIQTESSQSKENAVLPEKAWIPDASLVERYSLPVRVIKEFQPELLHTPAGELVYDVGQNISGIFRFRAHVPEGKRIRLQFGEVLQDGNFYNENLRTAIAEYAYTGDGNEHVLVPHFTFYGYRYVKVEGIEDAKAEDFTALAISSNLENRGELVTGNELVNQLVSNIRWGCLDNFVDVPTDCPQRDERMGWTGDTQVFSPSASYLLDTYAFYRKYLHDMALEQETHGGNVPYVIPSFQQDAGSAVWGDAATIIPWNLYRFSGDKTILQEQFDSMKGWVEYIRKVDGEDCGWRREFHFGDWLALDLPGSEADGVAGATDKAFIADAYYLYSTELVEKAAGVLGKTDEAAEYHRLAEQLRKRITEEFYSPTGRCCCDTQTGLLLTLKFHLAPEERTKERLRQKLRDNDYKLDCGFVGAPILCMVLAEHGMEDLAERLLMNEEFPGWLHEIHLGATTVWERWNSLDEDGHISSTGMNSLNHYAYGSILEWMYAHLAGIQELEPGFRRVRFEPKPLYQLGNLSASYRSASGMYKSSWKAVDAEHLEISVTVPFGAEAELVLPFASEDVMADRANPMFMDVRDGICHLTSGTYTAAYRTNVPMEKKLTIQNKVREMFEEPQIRKKLEEIIPAFHQIPESDRSLPLEEMLKERGMEPGIIERVRGIFG